MIVYDLILWITFILTCFQDVEMAQNLAMAASETKFIRIGDLYVTGSIPPTFYTFIIP